jgi:hypothetical protein
MESAWQLNENSPLGHAFDLGSSIFIRIQRRIDAIERSYKAALQELERLQSTAPPPPPEPVPAPQPIAIVPASRPIGFVPQNWGPPAGRPPINAHPDSFGIAGTSFQCPNV